MISFIPREGIRATLTRKENVSGNLLNLEDGCAVKPGDTYVSYVRGVVSEMVDVENPVYDDAYLVVHEGRLCAALTRDWMRHDSPDARDALIEGLTKIKTIVEELV